jgi:hypothetical protein
VTDDFHRAARLCGTTTVASDHSASVIEAVHHPDGQMHTTHQDCPETFGAEERECCELRPAACEVRRISREVNVPPKFGLARNVLVSRAQLLAGVRDRASDRER